MRIAIIFLLLTSIAGLQAQQKEESVTLRTKTGNIEGSFLIPEPFNSGTVVMIIAGSGPTDRNGNNPMASSNAYRILADSLCRNGIATLRFDKRGIGASRAAMTLEKHMKFEDYISDAEAWIELLRADKRFSKLVVLGHSEGSLIGMIASQAKAADKFISIAGSGLPAGELLCKQLEKQPPHISGPAFPILGELEEGRTVDSVPPILFTIFRPSVQPYLISWFKYDPCQEIAKLKMPVLIVQGTTDIQVSRDQADLLDEASSQAELAVIEGMNHVLKEAPSNLQLNYQTYNNPELPLAEGLTERILDFILE